MVLNNTKVKPVVYNLSSVDLKECENELLALGPKMVSTTNSDLLQNKIDILNFSRKLLLIEQFHGKEEECIDLIKPESAFIPKFTKSAVLKGIVEDLELYANELSEKDRLEFNDNLTKIQREGLKSLKSKDNILISKADKGSSFIVLDRDFYRQKVLEKLESSTYQKIHRNVDYFTMLKLKTFCKKYGNCLTKKEKNAITKFDFKTTFIYGLPKIHKSHIIKDAVSNSNTKFIKVLRPLDLGFRVIFGGPNNPTTGLASLVNEILNPFVTQVKSVVKDSVDFINRMPVFAEKDLPYIQMWSVDIKDMYPSINHSLGMEALQFWLEKFPNLLPSRFSVQFILEAMFFILENNVGYFNGDYYKQVVGTATGIKPAPPYANLTIGYLEIKLFFKLNAKEF